MGLRADIIVDDFDDPVAIDLPVPFASDRVLQEGVGPLAATRRTEVVDTNVDAMGSVSSHDSLLELSITGTNPDAEPFRRVVALNLWYGLDAPIDVSGYEFLAVDFAVLESPTGILPRIDALVLDTDAPAGLFVLTRLDVPTPSGAVTLYFPLDSFSARSSGGGRVFSNVTGIVLSTDPIWRSGGDPSFQFRAQIDRIRFTSIPEPPAAQVLALSAGCFGIRLPRRRR